MVPTGMLCRYKLIQELGGVGLVRRREKPVEEAVSEVAEQAAEAVEEAREAVDEALQSVSAETETPDRKPGSTPVH